MWFQSLSRDSGRLNPYQGIPEEVVHRFQSLSRDSGRLNFARGDFHDGDDGGFNPSVGIRGV